jgi:hypothetical protein
MGYRHIAGNTPTLLLVCLWLSDALAEWLWGKKGISGCLIRVVLSLYC